MLVAEAEHHGTIESDERRMIAGVMRLGDRAVRALMTPRTDVDWINLQSDEPTTRKTLMETQHSRLPAGDGSVDAMVGVIQTREVLAAMLAGQKFDPSRHVHTAPIVHDQADALDVLTTLKESDIPVALVHDEYGHFEGIVTPADILEAITGVFRADIEAGDQEIVKREDGSWLLPGFLPADELADHLNFMLPENRDYETLAGFILSQMHRLPATGEWVDAHGCASKSSISTAAVSTRSSPAACPEHGAKCAGKSPNRDHGEAPRTAPPRKGNLRSGGLNVGCLRIGGTGYLQRLRPPDKLIERVAGCLVEMGELAELLALALGGKHIRPEDMNAGTYGRHLQFDGMQPQLFDGTGAANTAVAEESHCLVVPFVIGVVERVLEHARRPAVVFGCQHDVAVEFGDLLLPLLRHLVPGRRVGEPASFVEERHRVVTQIEHLDVDVPSCLCDVEDPFRGLIGKTPCTRAADYDTYLWLGHRSLL